MASEGVTHMIPVDSFQVKWEKFAARAGFKDAAAARAHYEPFLNHDRPKPSLTGRENFHNAENCSKQIQPCSISTRESIADPKQLHPPPAIPISARYALRYVAGSEHGVAQLVGPLNVAKFQQAHRSGQPGYAVRYTPYIIETTRSVLGRSAIAFFSDVDFDNADTTPSLDMFTEKVNISKDIEQLITLELDGK
ncbi:Uu.00g130040.m01.CDS01 [Anthostomella pinea]|uniref:Uu.00g130040.m01.CDS01 n=1 Tax=Anthostomella pinea TaxID=933095 RepID=A0AAI8YI14_9PEZI|nr:Uu.00g130040.m01.CDS01 [Anthostomella pinea]